MEHYNLIKPEDLGKGSSVKLDVSIAEVDMYWKVAIEVLETIEENNKKGEPTLMVVPYGPLGPYARIAELAGSDNRQNTPLIEFVEEAPKEEKPKAAQKKTPAKRSKKAAAE